MEIGKKTDHSGPGVCDTPWIPKEGIPLGGKVNLGQNIKLYENFKVIIKKNTIY